MKLKITLLLSLLLPISGYLKSQVCNERDIITKLTDRWKQYEIDKILSPDDPGALTKFKRVTSGKKQVFVYGTWHNLLDDGHPMYKILESNFNTFKPTVVLTENYKPFYNTASEAILNDGDVAYTKFLAQKSNVPSKSWDAMAYAYNKIIREFGADASLLMALNVLDYGGSNVQFTEANYGSAINLLMYEGVSFTPEQTRYEYYKKIFEKFFKEPLVTDNEADFRKQRERNIKNKTLQKIRTRFMVLRDFHMLNIIKDELKIHDRVFVQAGAGHVSTTAEVLSCVFSPQLKNTNHPVKYKVASGTNNGMIKLLDNISNKQIHIYPITNTTDSLTTQKEMIARYIKTLRPDLILTEEYAPILSTKNETIARSGLMGFARYIAAENNINFQKWTPSWNSVYQNFVSNHSANELYTTIIGNEIHGYLEAEKTDPIVHIFMKTCETKLRGGYPFQLYQMDISYFINKIMTGTNRKDAYSVPEIAALIKKQINYTLLDSINRWRVYDFLDRAYEGKESQNKRIIVFIDETDMQYVKEYISHRIN